MPAEPIPSIADMYDAMDIVGVVGMIALRIADRMLLPVRQATMDALPIVQGVTSRVYGDPFVELSRSMNL